MHKQWNLNVATSSHLRWSKLLKEWQMLKTYKVWMLKSEHIDEHDYNKPLIENPFVKIIVGNAETAMHLINEYDPLCVMYVLKSEEVVNV
jgi:hypothetical protein